MALRMLSIFGRPAWAVSALITMLFFMPCVPSAHGEETFTIGVVVLDPKIDQRGKHQIQTIQMLTHRFNQESGTAGAKIKLRPAYYSRDEDIGRILTNLIKNVKVHAIIGLSTRSAANAAMKGGYADTTPLMICTPDLYIDPREYPWVFQSAPRIMLRIDKALEHAKSKGIRQVDLLGPEKDIGLLIYAERIAAKLNLRVTKSYLYQPHMIQNQRSLADRYKEAKCPTTAVLFFQRYMKFETKIWESVLGDEKSPLYVLFPHIFLYNRTPYFPAGPATKVVVPLFLVPHLLPVTEKQRQQRIERFFEDYCKLWGQRINSYDVFAHDAFKIIVNALTGLNGDVDQVRSGLRGRIEATKGFMGLAGEFNFSKADHNGLSSGVFSVQYVNSSECINTERKCKKCHPYCCPEKDC